MAEKGRIIMKKTTSLILALALILGMISLAFAQSQTTLDAVATEYGLAQGVPSDGDPSVTIFKGIPYAAPPVGDLRWKAPEDPAAWEGVRTFDNYSPAAMQYPDGMNAEPWKTDFYYGGVPEFSEDCLYLNVATSATTGQEKMPVLVWFHGGGLRHGFSYEVEFNNEIMAKKGVVVVTVGQRLGVYGYLALPQLSAETDYNGSGNYGLMDQIKALEWVRDNIAAFGGDPNNVTVGGQSGGTTKTGALFATDYAKGLQHRVIWESGLKWGTKFPEPADAERKGVEWLKYLGLKGDESLEELRAKDASFFMGTVYDDYANLAPNSMNKDNKYITVDSLKECFVGGALQNVDVLCGTNLGEASYTQCATKEEFFANYKEMLGDLYKKYDFENLVAKYYNVTDANANDVARALASYGLTTQDSRNLTLSQLFGKKLGEVGADGGVYAYLFSHFAPGRNVATDWAWHSSEMWYTFDSMRDIPQQRAWTEYDHQLADIMSSYWTNFMKTGDPNGEGLPEWKPSTAETLSYIDLGDEIKNDTEIDPLDELLIAYNQRQFGIE